MWRFDWRGLLRFQGGSVLMIVCGGILAVSPDSASVLISAVLGWLLIAAGVAMILAGVIDGAEIVLILQGAFFLLAGSWLHRHPLLIASVLGIVLGLTALCQGWRKAKRARRTKRYGGFWAWDAGVAALELLAGLVLIFVPLSLSRLVVTLAGIAMVLCGGADLYSSWKTGCYLEGDSRIIDADK